MWPFRRKPKNRRFEQAKVLEVKRGGFRLRTLQGRGAPKAVAALLTALILLFFLWRGGSWMMDQLVYENPAFAIKEIDVQSDGVISPDQIRSWADLKQGQNLMALDLDRIKRDLELVPVIRGVAIERVLPQTLRLRIAERVPVAQVLQPMGAGVREQIPFTLDAQGFVMLPVSPQQRAVPWAATNQNLPVITGVNYVELRPGRAVESLQVKAALRLITEFERSPMAGLVDLRWLDLASREVMVLHTGNGSRISFSMDNIEQQLRRWRVVHDYVQRQGKALASLDLSVVNNVPYTTVEAAAQPPVPPRTIRNIRATNKKRDV
jgi:cell division septal protein FtsQ